MKINNYNKLPQGINDMADLQIHEASMLIGAAIKTLVVRPSHATR